MWRLNKYDRTYIIRARQDESVRSDVYNWHMAKQPPKTTRTKGTAHEPTLRPDGRRASGDRTRHPVLKQAMQIAATEGLEGLTFGGIASAAEVPKSTLQVLFKDRETLQLQTLSAAADEFAAGI